MLLTADAPMSSDAQTSYLARAHDSDARERRSVCGNFTALNSVFCRKHVKTSHVCDQSAAETHPSVLLQMSQRLRTRAARALLHDPVLPLTPVTVMGSTHGR